MLAGGEYFSHEGGLIEYFECHNDAQFFPVILDELCGRTQFWDIR